MNREERKAAIGAYKELKVEAGVFALRCTVDNRRWIGRAQNLATIENRLRFTLKRGKSPSAALQAAWHGTLIRDRSRDGCFRAFRANHWVGFAVFAGVVADFALR